MSFTSRSWNGFTEAPDYTDYVAQQAELFDGSKVINLSGSELVRRLGSYNCRFILLNRIVPGSAVKTNRSMA
jgi:hypothetical protein